MTDILVRVSLSGSSDFHALALAPGLPMLDPKKLTYQVLLGWFGDLLADPSFDESGVTFRLPPIFEGSQGIQRTLATDSELDGPLAADFERLKKALFDIRPVSPAERLIFNRLNPPIANHEGMLYRIRTEEGLDRLVWCWGFQRRVVGGRTRICPNRECSELFLHQEDTPEVCPRCGQSFAIALTSAKRKTARRPIGAIVATAALTAVGLGTYWFAANATDEGGDIVSPLALLEPRNLQSAEKPDPFETPLSDKPSSAVKNPDGKATVGDAGSKVDPSATDVPETVIDETPAFPSNKVTIANPADESLLPEFAPSFTPPKLTDPELPDLSSTKTDPGLDVPKLELPKPTDPALDVKSSSEKSVEDDPKSVEPADRPKPETAAIEPGTLLPLPLPSPNRSKPSSKPSTDKQTPEEGLFGPLFPAFPKSKTPASEPKVLDPEPFQSKSIDTKVNDPKVESNIGPNIGSVKTDIPEFRPGTLKTDTPEKESPVRLTPTLEPSATSDGVPPLSEVPQRERRASRLKWHGDYLAAYQQAINQQRQLILVLDEPFQGDKTSAALDAFATPETEQLLESFVRANLPTGATVPGISESEAATRLLEHRAFRHLNGRAGIAIIDLTDAKSPYFGRVVSALPLPESSRYSSELLQKVLRLPPGSIGQRSLVLAIRSSLPDKNSAEGTPNELLTQLASRSTRLMAQHEQVGSFEQPGRITSVIDRFGADVRMREIVFATLAPTTVQDASVEAVRQWIQNADDRAALSQASTAYGVDLYQSPSSQRWYASCLIVTKN